MSKNIYDEILEAIDRWFEETPPEEIQKEFERIDSMNIEGPTVDEYFELLNKVLSISNWLKEE